MHRLLKVTLHSSRREEPDPLVVGKREELAALSGRHLDTAVSIWLTRTPSPRRELDPQDLWGADIGRNSRSVLAEEVHPSTIALGPQRRDEHDLTLRPGTWTAKLCSVRQQHIGVGQNHQARVEKSELSNGRPIGELSDVIGPVGDAGRVYAEEVFGERFRVSLRVTPLESEPYRSLKLDHLTDFNHEVSLPVSRAEQVRQTNSTPDLRVMGSREPMSTNVVQCRNGPLSWGLVASPCRLVAVNNSI